MERLKPETAFVVVAKAPVVGKVKTRLCPPLTFQQAATLYQGFLQDTIEIALRVPASEVKVVCPSQADAVALASFLPPQVGYIVQTETGLTDALTTAFEQCLSAGYQKVFCVSSDNPTLPLAYLLEAMAKIDATDIVLGPSEDGGYYLIGAKAVYPSLFSNMTWSTDTVLAETLERANHAGLRTALLPLWYDLDTGTELARFVQELAQSETGARHTRVSWQSFRAEEIVRNSPPMEMIVVG